MKNKDVTLEMISFDKIKDEFIGEVGTVKRTLYEQELQLEMLGDLKEVGSSQLAVGSRDASDWL